MNLSQIAYPLRQALFQLRFGSHWGKMLSQRGVSFDAGAYCRANHTIRIKPFDFPLVANRDEWLLDGIRFANPLHGRAAAHFQMLDSGVMRISTSHFNVDVTTFQELFVLNEVLCETLYHFQLTEPSVVIDIGMNTGFASLYLASLPGVERVFAYEPVEQVFNTALHNLSLNSALASKIIAVNKGVGGSSRRVRLNYSPMDHARSSIFNGRSIPEGQCHQTVDVWLDGIRDVIRSVKERSTSNNVIAKIDCEGCEYEIINALADSGDVKEILHLMIEWHQFDESHDPKSLAEVLEQCGFVVSMRLGPIESTGMLYATRVNARG
jgi:FkbM family methyltransferase